MRRVLLAALLAATVSGASEPATPTKSIDIVASKYKFTPDLVEVTLGDVVELRVKSADVEHGIGIKAYKVKKLVPDDGSVVVVTFVADKAGTFDIACSEYCGKGHKQMKAKLIVKEVAK